LERTCDEGASARPLRAFWAGFGTPLSAGTASECSPRLPANWLCRR
jgi:hypothetical protein